jgi:hypothetical protein
MKRRNFLQSIPFLAIIPKVLAEAKISQNQANSIEKGKSIGFPFKREELIAATDGTIKWEHIPRADKYMIGCDAATGSDRQAVTVWRIHDNGTMELLDAKVQRLNQAGLQASPCICGKAFYCTSDCPYPDSITEP